MNDWQTVLGVCPSKSNGYRISNGRVYKSDAVRAYEQSFYLQCHQYRHMNITGLHELHLNVYYPSLRNDLDGSLKAVLDCLQKVHAISNDNKTIKIVAQKFTDKTNPRIEFKIIEV